MALPQAVQKQADESERLLQEYKDNDDTGTVLEEPEVIEQEAEPEASIPDWEHKFSVLQGKYNAELPRLNQDLHNLRDDNRALQEQIAELAKKPEVEAPKMDLEDIRLEAGDGAADALAQQQATIEKQNQMIDELRQKIGQIGQSSQQSSDQMFYASLENAVPKWKTINTNPKFIAWLGEVDEYSGKPRLELMNEAAGNLEASRVATFFLKWIKTNAGKKSGIEKLVTPKTNQSSSQVAGSKTYTRAEIKKFYDDIARGKYTGTEAQKVAMDQDITRAQGEGRIAA